MSWSYTVNGVTITSDDFAGFAWGERGVPKLLGVLEGYAAYLSNLISQLDGAIVDLGGWQLTANGMGSPQSGAVEFGKIVIQMPEDPAWMRVSGVGGGGHQISIFGAPVQLVLHRANGGPGVGEELPVNLGDTLFHAGFRGTINFSDGQGFGAIFEVKTIEDTSVTGKIGSVMRLASSREGDTIPGADSGLKIFGDRLEFNGRQFMNDGGLVAGAASNFAINPSMLIWPAGTSFAIAANTTHHLALGYKTRRTITGATYSRVAGHSGAQYALRMQRDSGNTDLQNLPLWFQIPPETVIAMRGKTIYVEADLKAGANYSGGAFAATIYTGTGTDEAVTMTGVGIGFATGAANSDNLSMGSAPTTTESRKRTTTGYTVPSGATDLAVRIFYNPTGTAGAADFADVTQIGLVDVSGATYVAPTVQEATREGLRYFRKSFAPATTPAQNVGTGTGEERFPAITAGATAQRPPSVRWAEPMRAVPTITLFNPAAANAQVRDITAGADCSSSATTNVSVNGFDITATGNASTAAGNSLGVHWTADARR